MDPVTVVLAVVNLVFVGAGFQKVIEQKQDAGGDDPDDLDDGGGTWCGA